ncbi:hypothetical protein MNB_SV-6-255 [hydrothermal vent metagenome]|uniref:Uncharacterized protein n=1 Tax=hydrothermal vent metagenome TaxID=652676 RepID=A0A1W1CE29_9ZZZZ
MLVIVGAVAFMKVVTIVKKSSFLYFIIDPFVPFDDPNYIWIVQLI